MGGEMIEGKVPEITIKLNQKIELPAEPQRVTLKIKTENNLEDEDFCFNGFIDMAYLEKQAKKVAANPVKLDVLLIDFRSAVAQATRKQRDSIRQRIEPIYPELFDFL